MSNVTYLGDGTDGSAEVVWGGATFKVGEAVEVKKEDILKKASTNPMFKVEGWTAPGVEVADPVTYPAPSEQSAQGPVPKPGEPVRTVPKAMPKI